MSKKYFLAGGIAVALAGIITLSHSVLAYRGNPSATGPNFDPQRHQEMQNAFDSNDYSKWKELMGNRGRVTEKINESNFAKFAEMRKLKIEGKTEEVNRIREELGLGQGRGQGDGWKEHGKNHNGNFVDDNHDGICDRLQ